MSTAPITIDLLRHGDVAGPPALYGRTDVALSETGWSRLHRVPLVLPYQAVLSSPRRRCRDYAEQIASQRTLPLRLVDDLAEMDFGEWDGVPFSVTLPQWSAMTAFWQAPSLHGPPGGETLDGFRERVVAAWRMQASLATGPQLWVVHAGVIRAILADVLAVDFCQPAWHQQLHIGYASRTRLLWDPGQAQARIQWIGLPPPEE